MDVNISTSGRLATAAAPRRCGGGTGNGGDDGGRELQIRWPGERIRQPRASIDMEKCQARRGRLESFSMAGGALTARVQLRCGDRSVARRGSGAAAIGCAAALAAAACSTAWGYRRRREGAWRRRCSTEETRMGVADEGGRWVLFFNK
jgi:hypothetical protein